MERALLETIFLCGVALLVLLEIFYLQNFSADRKALNVQKKKRIFLFLLILGIQVVPLIYIFSIDFGQTDYHIWKWLSFPVLIFYIFCIWLFGKALADLGRWWAPGQELKNDLELVRTGAFFYVRHPMYTAIIGIAVCQIFMIQNWIAGPISLILVAPFCIYQIRREERLLIQFFGDDYRDYIRQTGMLWPKEDKLPFLRRVIRQLFLLLQRKITTLWHFIAKYSRRKSSGLMNGGL
jgi:protein-S-isoprenylcysteine O-methyltransferase Ste14